MENRVYFDIPKLSTAVSFDLDERYKNIKDMTEEDKKDIVEKVTLIMGSSARMISKEEYERIIKIYENKAQTGL